MLLPVLRLLIARELRTVRREIEAYPDDESVWRSVPGLPNSGGTLALHVAGNIQHYIGAILGKDGYRRDRDAEFSRRGVPRAAILSELDAAIAAVERTLDRRDDALMSGTFPEPIAKRKVPAMDFLVHVLAHLAYHLGQIDYHRRTVTADTRGVDAISVRELPEVS